MLLGFCFFNLLHKFCFLLEFFNISIFYFYFLLLFSHTCDFSIRKKKGKVQQAEMISEELPSHRCWKLQPFMYAQAKEPKGKKNKNTHKGTISQSFRSISSPQRIISRDHKQRRSEIQWQQHLNPNGPSENSQPTSKPCVSTPADG